MTFSPYSGRTILRLSATAGRWIYIHTSLTYDANVSARAFPLQNGKRGRQITLSGCRTFRYPRPNPRKVTFGLVLPDSADGLQFVLRARGKLVVGPIRGVDRGRPTSAEPEGKELLTDPGWEKSYRRAVFPGGSFGRVGVSAHRHAARRLGGGGFPGLCDSVRGEGRGNSSKALKALKSSAAQSSCHRCQRTPENWSRQFLYPQFPYPQFLYPEFLYP